MQPHGLVDILKGFTSISEELKSNKLDWMHIYDN